tara:strand:- start:294 stop:1010 length:717 start_codon:yes stop_codon:yes gene_type:complete
MSSKKYIFDVDGTLTPARQQIDPEFLLFMMFFASRHEVYLVTGSDRDKTLEQIGVDLYNAVKRVYNCSGSDVYEGDRNVYRDDWELPKEVEQFLYDELDFSQFPIRNGDHIERRPGGVNFSILGRGKGEGREEYIKWDKRTNERKDIWHRLKYCFPNLEVNIGGQTGLDLGPVGVNKSQILRDFRLGEKIYFFGDMMEEGQNDYPLLKAVQEMGGSPYTVKNWEDTRTRLVELTSSKK